jgi:phospholipase/carboxylesterase
VPTAIETELISFNGWTLRVRAAQSKHPRLLVLIHGWTGDENSMWIFARALSPDYWIIAPRAPYPTTPSGFSWRPPELAQGDNFGRPTLETLRPAVEALIQLVDEYATSVKVDAAQFDLMGFSQGAVAVNLIGLLYPQRIRKMGVLSGFVPPDIEEIIAKKPLTGKQIFVAHGAKDKIIPLDFARASVEALKQAGAQIIYCEGDVGHKLSANCLRALEEYLSSPAGRG